MDLGIPGGYTSHLVSKTTQPHNPQDNLVDKQAIHIRISWEPWNHEDKPLRGLLVGEDNLGAMESYPS